MVPFFQFVTRRVSCRPSTSSASSISAAGIPVVFSISLSNLLVPGFPSFTDAAKHWNADVTMSWTRNDHRIP